MRACKDIHIHCSLYLFIFQAQVPQQCPQLLHVNTATAVLSRTRKNKFSKTFSYEPESSFKWYDINRRKTWLTVDIEHFHATLLPPCWRAKTIHFSPLGNKIYFVCKTTVSLFQPSNMTAVKTPCCFLAEDV